VLEIKTEMTSAEATVRKLDEKVRLARKIAFERFGWAADSVSRLLVVEESTTNRRRVATAAALFNVAVPARAVAVRTWLGAPSGTLSGMLFLPFTNGRRGMSPAGGRHRVRRAAADKASDPRSAVTASREADDEAARPVILTNRT
jgi:hypothetical protein